MTRMLLGPRDKAVYRWELDARLDAADPSRIEFGQVQAVINCVWSDMGLRHPPLAKLDRTLGRTSAYANRRHVTVGELVNHVTLFHELAHSMDVSLETSSGLTALRPSSEVSGGSYHDENWLGLYVNLLDRYLGPAFNKLRLYGLLQEAGISVSYNPRPRCI